MAGKAKNVSGGQRVGRKAAAFPSRTAALVAAACLFVCGCGSPTPTTRPADRPAVPIAGSSLLSLAAPAGSSAAARSSAPKGTAPAAAAGSAPQVPAGKGLVNGVVFGLPVYGVHPETLDRLEQAQQFLGARRSAGTGARGWGVQSIGGYRANSRGHSRGLAVDINYYANPYVLHESGEAEQDARLAPVYHRIARLMLKRDSVIPARITQGAISERRTLQLFRALRNESRAMTGYFRLMRNRAQLERHLPSAPERTKGLSARFGVPDRALLAAALQRRMLEDYVLLAGRPGPAVPGLQYPAPDPALAGDAPFTGDPKLRAPELGFLNLPEELVRTLTAVGFRWGGTDMGRQSGDLMHFYLPEQAVNLRPNAPSKPAAKKKE